MIGTVQWTTYGQGKIVRVLERRDDLPLVLVELQYEALQGLDLIPEWVPWHSGLVQVWAELGGPCCGAERGELKAPESGR